MGHSTGSRGMLDLCGHRRILRQVRRWRAGDSMGNPTPVRARCALHPLAACLATMLTMAPLHVAGAATLPVTNCLDDGSVGTLRSVIATAVDGDVVDLTQLTCSTITLTAGAIDTSFAGQPGDRRRQQCRGARDGPARRWLSARLRWRRGHRRVRTAARAAADLRQRLRSLSRARVRSAPRSTARARPGSAASSSPAPSPARPAAASG